jgi:HTH-type transcriptional regulator / antitoxin HipB
MANIDQLPKTILAHRKKSGLSRIALAKLAGVNKKVIFEIEHGEDTVQLDTLLKVLAVLNIRVTLSSPLIETLPETTL